ncbi:unnamed protein product [Adineta steineri]|uniref:Uncharacterized protein n=1 Tax=Adineta steineri TaxID=433720 RepID=A0A818RVQ6_9BILA|nr:unnamed protein product [Adineta steineri]
MIYKILFVLFFQPNIDCKLALKKRQKLFPLHPTMKKIVKINENVNIYSTQKHLMATDEYSFCSSLSTWKKKSTDQFVPCVKIAHEPGAIFPLICAQQRLFSFDYHHEGGIHHSYIIPADQREALQKLVDQQNSSIQHPNEFIILSAGTLAQSYTEDVSWTESINFALPTWVEEGHANISVQPCQCHIEQNCVVDTIDVTLFKQKLIEKYVTSYLKTAANDESPVLIGTSFC